MDSGKDYEETNMITDDQTIDEIKNIFKQIEWTPNVQVEMERGEDVFATFFYQLNHGEPERLYEYRFWFEDSGGATIISNNEKEGYGTLNEDAAKELRTIFFNSEEDET
ncbi:hypothetical protein AHA02nite_02230 [Alkalibacillus haloalkaliphilus]|uniref:Uncharacterized protein n=1 Tax=Alkalibacillus haloalkaliphilus TaxID=94136 RepID=A0A511W034_9BACI|nr:hypothetical protein AHA02nite_02230 [Alkalibacillus haloalkaliphilus]